MPKGAANKRDTTKLRQRVVEAVMKEGVSYRKTARLYEADGHNGIQGWERIYLAGGLGY